MRMALSGQVTAHLAHGEAQGDRNEGAGTTHSPPHRARASCNGQMEPVKCMMIGNSLGGMAVVSDMIVETVHLGSRCQMVLPARIRKALGLREGDEVLVRKSGDVVLIVPKPASYAQQLRGLHREVWRGVDPDRYVREERESWEG